MVTGLDMATATTMSGAAFDQLPYEEGSRWELVQGEMISIPPKTPSHQIIVSAITVNLDEYFRRHHSGIALMGCEYDLGKDDRLCPDVGILLNERWAAIDKNRTPIPLAPNIAVEVITESDLMTNTATKMWTYFGAGVQEVWQVAPQIQRILAFQSPKSGTTLGIDEVLNTPLLPGWEISVREIFEG